MEVAKPHENPAENTTTTAAAAPAAAPSGPDSRRDLLNRLSDAPDLLIKHPLQHKWVMWYDCAQKKVGQAAWGEQLRKVVAVDTVRASASQTVCLRGLETHSLTRSPACSLF